MVAAPQDDDALAGICLFDLSPSMSTLPRYVAKMTHSLARVLPPQCAQAREQLLHLGFAPARETSPADSRMRSRSSGKADSTADDGQLFALRAVVLDAIVDRSQRQLLLVQLAQQRGLSGRRGCAPPGRGQRSRRQAELLGGSARALPRCSCSRPSMSSFWSCSIASWIVSISRRRRSVRRTAAKLDAAIFWKIVITKPSARPLLPCRLASAKPSSRYSRSAS